MCRHCARELGDGTASGATSRLLSEGEAESKDTELSSAAMAKWADPARTTLVCPRCGITEPVEKS